MDVSATFSDAAVAVINNGDTAVYVMKRVKLRANDLENVDDVVNSLLASGWQYVAEYQLNGIGGDLIVVVRRSR